ncbi:DUF47 domain-containing protein [Brachymonas denitrificans]|uniref:DUF47 domain-containing protein n=1 Tax=Brachymonas denitrificans TaxID=28220 RepID=UPI002AFFB612|nr:DUF47 family protein [Brachymonas denitrificans]
MIFSKLLPHEGNFFELTSRHSDCIVDAARNFCQLVMNYSDRDVRVALAKEVDAAELRANAVAAEFNTALHKTFITPVDREQLHQLIGSMDGVADLLRDSAETMALYDLQAVTPELAKLSEVSLLCCERMDQAIKQLTRLGKGDAGKQALLLCSEVDALESEADHVMRQGMSRLFREEPDVRELIKLKAMYDLLEAVTDRCEDVAKLIEGIVLENA